MSQPIKISLWFRWYYCLFYKSSALYFFIFRRLRVLFFGWLALIIICIALGFGYAKPGVFHMISFLLLLFIAAVVHVYFRKAKLEAHRVLPRYATVGEWLHYPIQITSLQARGISNLYFIETPNDARPSLHLFRSKPQHNQERYNIFDRWFYRWRWLMEERTLFEGKMSAGVMKLEPYSSTSCLLSLMPKRRGVLRLDDVRCLLPDWLGLLQRCVRIKQSTESLIVLPKRYVIPKIVMEGQGDDFLQGSIRIEQKGQEGDYIGLRDYQYGDSLRQIHWKSWAKTGKPVVMEFETISQPQFLLLLDQRVAYGHEFAFEAMVSLTASLVARLDGADSKINALLVSDHDNTMASSLIRSEQEILNRLASLEITYELANQQLLNGLMRHRDEISGILVMSCGWDHARVELLRDLQSLNIPCSLLIVGSGPCPDDYPFPYWLNAEDIQQSIYKLPNTLESIKQ